jgi:hypothetical protein
VDFYECFEKQSEASMPPNLNGQKVDQICDNSIAQINKLRKLIKVYLTDHPEEKSVMLPPISTILLEENCVSGILELFEDRTLDGCNLGYYRKTSTEHFVWGWTLLLMSWSLRNLKGKVEVGSCHNDPSHRHGQSNMLCPEGSKFHLDFYNECLESLENIIQAAKLNPPSLISSEFTEFTGI